MIRIRRGLREAIHRLGLLYGQPGLVTDDPTRPKLLLGDEGGVPRRLTMAQEDVDGLIEALATLITPEQLAARLVGRVTDAQLAQALADKITGPQLAQALLPKADLINGVIPAAQLPSYVDDVLEYSALSAFPAIGEGGKLYLARDTNLPYRWTGSTYIEISQGLALGETAATAYRGDRGAAAYGHAQTAGNPHATAIADIQGLAALASFLTSHPDYPPTGLHSDSTEFLTLPTGWTAETRTGQTSYAVASDYELFCNNSELYLRRISGSGSGKAYTRPVTPAHWRVTAKIAGSYIGDNTNGAGLQFRSSAGNTISIRVSSSTGPNTGVVVVISRDYVSYINQVSYSGMFAYVRVTYNGSTLVFESSSSGRTWTLLVSGEPIGAGQFLTNITRYGVDTAGGAIGMTDFFRVEELP